MFHSQDRPTLVIFYRLDKLKLKKCFNDLIRQAKTLLSYTDDKPKQLCFTDDKPKLLCFTDYPKLFNVSLIRQAKSL